MCLPPAAHADAMLPSSGPCTPKPPVPQCDNMNKIAEDMDVMRAIVSSGRRTTTEYLSLCLIGYGTIERRDALMRVLQWTLEPLLLYSAFVKDVATKEFEAVIITKKQVSASTVEEWLGLFNMGLICIQFDAYMQADMVTCISRIHHMGRHWYGSFKAKPAARVRRDFYKEHMRETAARENQRVLTVTGMTVTPRNMLALHDRISNLTAHVAHLERQIQQRRSAADTTSAIAAEIDSSLANVAESVEAASRANLASAYRRLQARGDLPMSVSLRPEPQTPLSAAQTPPLVFDLTSPPHSPIPAAPASPEPVEHLAAPPMPDAMPVSHTFVVRHWHAPLVHTQGVAFTSRPPPTGLVTIGNTTVYVVRQ